MLPSPGRFSKFCGRKSSVAKNYTLALRKSMKQLGTYRPEYESAIAIAAQLMEQYDTLTHALRDPAGRMRRARRPEQRKPRLSPRWKACARTCWPIFRRSV